MPHNHLGFVPRKNRELKGRKKKDVHVRSVKRFTRTNMVTHVLTCLLYVNIGLNYATYRMCDSLGTSVACDELVFVFSAHIR